MRTHAKFDRSLSVCSSSFYDPTFADRRITFAQIGERLVIGKMIRGRVRREASYHRQTTSRFCRSLAARTSAGAQRV
jgi:hypothetical protein